MVIKLISLQNYPIYQQLQLEEALLRTSTQNYCLINVGSPPAIVMGISGKAEELIYLEKTHKQNTPIICRYSGGGTVVVDHNTIFVSFILQKDLVDLPLFPEPIMRWSYDFYQKALNIKDFLLKENDYTIVGKKCGGNAQYIQKNRFVHHTTFLWDFCPSRMNLLKLPKKRPSYRKSKEHNEFVTSLHPFLRKEEFYKQIQEQLTKTYSIEEVSINTLEHFLNIPHRKSTKLFKEKPASQEGANRCQPVN